MSPKFFKKGAHLNLFTAWLDTVKKKVMLLTHSSFCTIQAIICENIYGFSPIACANAQHRIFFLNNWYSWTILNSRLISSCYTKCRSSEQRKGSLHFPNYFIPLVYTSAIYENSFPQIMLTYSVILRHRFPTASENGFGRTNYMSCSLLPNQALSVWCFRV